MVIQLNNIAKVLKILFSLKTFAKGWLTSNFSKRNCAFKVLSFEKNRKLFEQSRMLIQIDAVS